MVNVSQHQNVRRTFLAALPATLGFVLIAPLPGATATPSRPPESGVVAQRDFAHLAGPLRQCGKTRHAKDISIVSYQYVDCATAQEVAARRAAGLPLPSIAPGAAVRWRCSERGSSNATSEFGSKLPNGYVECVGYRGGEFIRFKPLGSPRVKSTIPSGTSTWRAVGLQYTEVMYVVRNGSTVRTLDSGGPYGEMSCRRLNMTGDTGVGRAYGYGKPSRVRVTFSRSAGRLVVKQTREGYTYSQRYSRTSVAKANRQLGRQWGIKSDGLLQKRFRTICG